MRKRDTKRLTIRRIMLEEWFRERIESLKDDPEYQAEIIMLTNDWNKEPILRDDYDGD